MATRAAKLALRGKALTDTGTEIGIVNNADATAITIDASENVGIGTSSPATMLNLSAVNNGAGNVDNALRFTGTDTAVQVNGIAGRIEFATSDTGNQGVNAQMDVIYAGGGGSGEFQFRTGFAGSLVDAVRIDDTGKVGIGTSSPTSNIHIGATGADDKNELRIDGSNGSSAIFGTIIESDGENSRVSFKTGHGGATPTQRLMIHPDGGICFGTDTAAANALDDYEEGTWVPSVTGTTGGTVTSYHNRAGRYTKIGNQVTVWFYFHTQSVSGMSGSGAARIHGLPFSFSSDLGNNSGMGPVSAYYLNDSSLRDINLVRATDSSMGLLGSTSSNGITGNASWANVAATAFSGTALQGVFTYRTT